MADIKHKENGKWTVVDDKGRIYPNAGEFDTEKAAVKRLTEMEGHKAHSEETSAERKKKHSQVEDVLVVLADTLDVNGFNKEADIIDGILKSILVK